MTASLEYLLKRRDELQTNAGIQDSFNILVYGYVGTGKSQLLSTCRKPLYVFSFDPGGTKLKALTEMRDKGEAILDTDYENEDIKNPTAMSLFDRRFANMSRLGVFNDIGTVAIDSFTMMADAAVNFILKRENPL